MAVQAQSYYYSGQGVVLLADRDATTGAPTGFVPVGNVSSLKLQIKTDVVEHHESLTGARGIDLRLTRQTTCSVTMDVESINSANLNIALYGTSTVTTADTPVTGEANFFRKGKTIKLEHIKVSLVSVKKGGTAVTASDYTVNADTGSITFTSGTPATSGLLDGDAITIDYTYAAQSRVDALMTARPEKWMRFEGLNTARSNEPVVLDIFRFAADPLQELDYISDDIGKLSLQGTALADALRPNGTSQYFRQFMVQ